MAAIHYALKQLNKEMHSTNKRTEQQEDKREEKDGGP